MSPTLEAATAIIEKKPCFHCPFSTTLSFKQNKIGRRCNKFGRTDKSSPELKKKKLNEKIKRFCYMLNHLLIDLT